MKKQVAGRKLFSLWEAYRIVYLAFRSMPRFQRARKEGVASETFMERLMLAVTEVNKCAMCSYAHTKMALEAGLSQEEIHAMLSGDTTGANEEELPAILFAQHYADTRGKPDREAWETIVKDYGEEKSQAILGAIRVIMMGNAYGIPSGNLINRFSRKEGKKLDARSGLGYELAMVLTLPIYIIVALLQALIAGALRLPTAP
ncbi:MAG: carboxymuconolactone decarboxylase family protein [Eubacteriales bacterium]|nr:carboxymuconolactone decarboxylase family protein [Eubacteriales bacterium]